MMFWIMLHFGDSASLMFYLYCSLLFTDRDTIDAQLVYTAILNKLYSSIELVELSCELFFVLSPLDQKSWK